MLQRKITALCRATDGHHRGALCPGNGSAKTVEAVSKGADIVLTLFRAFFAAEE
jgi:hypothetical protein